MLSATSKLLSMPYVYESINLKSANIFIFITLSNFVGDHGQNVSNLSL
jgi:hypothetical protein